MTSWLSRLQPEAPDIVATYRGVEQGKAISVRREVRRRAGAGSARRVGGQLAAIARTLAEHVVALPDAAFARPGGEGDWNVAQAIGHDAHARAGLVLAAARAASGRWPAEAPRVVPGVPGAASARREELLREIARSQRLIERSLPQIAGHELDSCPLDHPLVGKLRCGEWLLFAGVHDLMHLEQLHGLARRLEHEEVS
jgi:hypothetical protein